MQDATLTLTSGWAIFAIACIIYFIANIVYGFGLLIEKKINTFKCLVNGEISLSWNTNNILKLY